MMYDDVLLDRFHGMHPWERAVMTTRPIHPFPARMAPEVALAQCAQLKAGSVVLDPMTGSGTVLRAAVEHGHFAMGFDTDPLAVLMARVWTTPIDPNDLRDAANDLVTEAQRTPIEGVRLPWIDEDPQTQQFVDYWFGPIQQADLRCLGALLVDRYGVIADALRIALSRIIVTKDRGASLGRDVSHSRPHRVFSENSFQVMSEFTRSASRLAYLLESQPPLGNAQVKKGDARNLADLADSSVDAIVTSPPYLNAIDYIRGHRLSLVWIGHRVGDLRTIRMTSIGAERAPELDADQTAIMDIKYALPNLTELPARIRRMVDRYLLDLDGVLRETRRVLKPGGRVTFVVGNSCLRGIYLDNAAVVTAAANKVGLASMERHERELPPSRRYLPPPVPLSSSELKKRMRTEVVLSFAG